jgi:hypothetical protein
VELGKMECDGANGVLMYFVLFGTYVRHELASDTL